MARVRLIATDLDGTLLYDDGSVSERSRRALHRAQETGIQVVLVSGRHPRSLRAMARATGVHGLAICSNGAIVYDPERDAILHHLALEPDVAQRLITGLRKAIPGVAFVVERGPDYSWEVPFSKRSGASAMDIPVCEDALALCTEPVTKLIAWHAETDTDALIEHAQRIAGEDEVTITYSTPHLIEISLAGVHKAAGLNVLCEEQGIRAEEVVAFGNMPNDIAMLRWAGRGIAVANAHPSVLAAADEVTDANVDDGVARVVERILRGVSQKGYDAPWPARSLAVRDHERAAC